MSQVPAVLAPIGLKWLGEFLTSSIGRKTIMSLTGLFLISFLFIHLLGNLKLLKADGGESFNLYAEFMTHNPLIKTVSYLLYFSILLHAVQGWLLWRKNSMARGSAGYAVKVTRGKGAHPRTAVRMGWLGTIIFIFILLHMYQFWLQMKLNLVSYATYDGETVKNLYEPVVVAFNNPVYVIIYVVSMVFIGFHLLHGFQSAFQTLGLNHQKYTPLIKSLGWIISIGLSVGFAIIPVIMYGTGQGWW